MKLLNICLVGLSLGLVAMNANAEVILPQFFTDSMVVQQNAVLTIPGKTKKNATVKITPSWDNATVKVKSDKEGNFVAKLNTPSAGGPYTITFDDGKKTILNDILAGEVWLCSGQSNMEMPVAGWGQVMDFRNEVANADSPNLRLLQIQKQTSYRPETDTKVNMGGWRSATPETVANFSSIGYFFGRDLNKAIDIPVGIIDCTWGGTPIEAWSAYETLSGLGECTESLATISGTNFDSDKLVKQYEENYANWLKLTEEKDIDFDKSTLQADWEAMDTPGLWEGTVLPDFDGIVWIQREFKAPSDWVGKEVTIHLSTIDDDDATYVNGVKIGETVGYNIPRVYKVPAGVIKEGDNVITVRIADYQGGGGLWGDAADMYATYNGKKIALDGKWNYKVSVDLADLPAMPISPVTSNFPTVLYNAMLHPMTVMPVQGILWYQGCANVGYAPQYSRMFKAMINDWRKDWNNDDMPFYFVQLAGYLQPKRFQPNSQWAALRQAQKDALELPNTEMVVAIDLGNPDDIHPKNKQEVARRLLQTALHNVYGQSELTYRAPDVKSTTIDGRYVNLTFDAPVTMWGGGQGFIVKDASGKWAIGYGRQTSDTSIVVSSDEIDRPVEVRYDWADYPEGNIRGLTGLPVSPFIAK